MATVIDAALRDQLLERRHRLENFVGHDDDAQLRFLLEEVDAALARMDEDTYGLCEVCQGTVETDRLLADPLVSVCLGCLTATQKRALEDLKRRYFRRLAPGSNLFRRALRRSAALR